MGWRLLLRMGLVGCNWLSIGLRLRLRWCLLFGGKCVPTMVAIKGLRVGVKVSRVLISTLSAPIYVWGVGIYGVGIVVPVVDFIVVLIRIIQFTTSFLGHGEEML